MALAGAPVSCLLGRLSGMNLNGELVARRLIWPLQLSGHDDQAPQQR